MPKARPTTAGGGGAETTYESKQGKETGVAVVTHVLGLLTLFLGPLVMYLLFRRRASPWLREHLHEAVNYHILVVAAVILLTVLAVVLTNLGASTVALICLGLLLVVVLANLVFSVAAILQAARGKSFHFPLDIKIVR